MMLMPYLAAIDVSLCGSAGRSMATAWATSPTGSPASSKKPSQPPGVKTQITLAGTFVQLT